MLLVLLLLLLAIKMSINSQLPLNDGINNKLPTIVTYMWHNKWKNKKTTKRCKASTNQLNHSLNWWNNATKQTRMDVFNLLQHCIAKIFYFPVVFLTFLLHSIFLVKTTLSFWWWPLCFIASSVFFFFLFFLRLIKYLKKAI